MIWLLYISIVVFVAYCSFAFSKCGITTTLSETHYHLPKWIFPVAMISCSILALPYWLEVSNTNYQFLAFLSCAGIIFLGVAPFFKDEDKILHMTAVYISCISAFIWAILTNWVVPCGLMVVMGVLIFLYRKYWALIAELGLFICIYLMLLFI